MEHVSLLHVGASSGYMPRSGKAGSSGSTMSNFLRNHQTDCQSGFSSFQSHEKWRSVLLFSTSSPAFAVLWVFDLRHSDWCEVESQGCFDLNFLMIKDTGHFFRCFSTIQYSSVENSLFSSVPHFNRAIWFSEVPPELLFMEEIMEGCHSLSESKMYYLSPPVSVECSRWCELKKIQRKTCWSVFLCSAYIFPIYIFWKMKFREQSVSNEAQVSSSQWQLCAYSLGWNRLCINRENIS